MRGIESLPLNTHIISSLCKIYSINGFGSELASYGLDIDEPELRGAAGFIHKARADHPREPIRKILNWLITSVTYEQSLGKLVWRIRVAKPGCGLCNSYISFAASARIATMKNLSYPVYVCMKCILYTAYCACVLSFCSRSNATSVDFS